MSRSIDLGHRRVIVIGESLGRHGLNQVLDTLLRSPESRYNSYIVTAYETTAKEVLSTPYLLEEIPAVGINNIMQSDFTLAVRTDEFLDALATYGKSPVTAGIRVTKMGPEIRPSHWTQLRLTVITSWSDFFPETSRKRFACFGKISRH